MENRNIVLTRDKILDRIWGYTAEVETRTLDVHIRSLRQKQRRMPRLSAATGLSRSL